MIKVQRAMGALALGLSMMSASCVGSCFVRGTRIVTPRGLRRIEDIAVGDEVYSFDVEARRPVVRKVARLLRAHETEILHITAGELSLVGVTPEHPFYDAEQNTWVRAGELREGTRLVAWLGASDVREIEVSARRHAPSAGKVEVFNLTIDGPEHNYFAEGLLVHNKDVAGEGPVDQRGAPCSSDAQCGGENLYCSLSSDGMCGPVSGTCEIFPASCSESPLRTVCGCDGKSHAQGACPGGETIQIDKRPESCQPPAGMYNCGDGACATDAQFCLEGFSAIKCADLPAMCMGAAATCDCLESAGMAGCGCLNADGGIRVSECAL